MRGGKRVGAGRKSEITPALIITVGNHCDRMARQKEEKRRNEAINKANPNASEEWEKVNAIPVSERKAWLQSEDREIHRHDVRASLQVDEGIKDDSEPARKMIVGAKRSKAPKGQSFRDEIIAQVAKEKKLTKRTVRTCWTEFRKLAEED